MSLSLDRHLPQDRRRVLVTGGALPERVSGAALLADLVGFTALGQRLTGELGVRRGVEELARRVNAVYEALIGAIEQRRGSVVGFAGDAVACWFDDADADAPARAVSCARAMQQAVRSFEGVGLKTAVTRGPARRFVVGDPQIQLLDTLAGTTVARLSTAERIARQGEVIVDHAAMRALGNADGVVEWRVGGSDERFAVLDAAGEPTGMGAVAAPAPAPIDTARDDQVWRPWVLPAVYEREHDGHGAFLIELRPTAALFIRFDGIDYDRDEQARNRLDQVVQCIQAGVDAEGGVLLQLTIGDKGSYAYACFGAPVAHEDDALRAVRSAHELMRGLGALKFLEPVRMGLSAGTARTGDYGGRTRATYGALGDDVNLAARLMALAGPGQILLSEALRRPAVPQFVLRALQPVQVKGYAEPVSVHALVGPRSAPTTQRAQERRYGIAMVGRQRELALVERKLVLAAEGQAQVIAIAGDAGIGKSRLVAEVVPFAQRHGFAARAGLCEAAGQGTPYLVWRSIWRGLLELDADIGDADRTASLRERLRVLAPQRLEALPTLAPLLGVAIEDNEFTRPLAPRDRATVLSALLEDCLKSAASTQPLLFVLEDVHWIDPASLQLLEDLVRVGARLPLVFVLAYRPQQGAGPAHARLEKVPGLTHIVLDVLEPGDVVQMVDNKLAQWEPGCSDEMAGALAVKLNARAEGNPFYIEELLNHLRDRGVVLREWSIDAGREVFELPPSLESLILSRIDSLSESQRAALKTASAIGLQFRVDWLHACYPSLGGRTRVKADLAELQRLDLTLQSAPEPELAYRFKHVVTREVTYESLPKATRIQLHGQFARYIESLGAERHLDLLAHHYGLSDDVDKQREYLRRAAEAAQAAYANETALAYWRRLLPLVEDDRERARVELNLGVLLTHIARYFEAEARLRAALALTVRARDERLQAAVAEALGEQFLARGQLREAREWIDRALVTWQSLGASREEGRAMLSKALTWLPERYEEVRGCAGRALTMATQCGDTATRILAATELGNAIQTLGDRPRGRAFLDDATNEARLFGDKRVLITVLNRQAGAASAAGEFAAARLLFVEANSLVQGVEGACKANATSRQDGHGDPLASERRGRASPVAAFALRQFDFAFARACAEDVLALASVMNDPLRECRVLIALGYSDLCAGELERAAASLERAESIVAACDLPMMRAEVLDNLGLVALARGELDDAGTRMRESLALRRRIGSALRIVYSLSGMTAVLARRGQMREAAIVAAAAHSACEMAGITLDASTSNLVHRAMESARDLLEPSELASAWAEGLALSLDEAAALTLAA